MHPTWAGDLFHPRYHIMRWMKLEPIIQSEVSQKDKDHLELLWCHVLGGSDGKDSACNARDLSLILGLGRSLEKIMATHFSILAWIITWYRSLAGYSLWGSQKLDMTDQRTHTHGVVT